MPQLIIKCLFANLFIMVDSSLQRFRIGRILKLQGVATDHVQRADSFDEDKKDGHIQSVFQKHWS